MSEAYRRDGFFPGPEPAGLEEEPSEREAGAVREAEAFLSRYGRMRKRMELVSGFLQNGTKVLLNC